MVFAVTLFAARLALATSHDEPGSLIQRKSLVHASIEYGDDAAIGDAECSADCSSAFLTKCIPHKCRRDSEEPYADCRSEVDNAKGPLAKVCSAGCLDTAEMLSSKSGCEDSGSPSPGPSPSQPSSSPKPSGGDGAKESEPTVPAEKPTVPTLCTAQNQGGCDCGSRDLKTYVFWPTTAAQRCFHVYNIPASVPSGGAQPVVLHMDGYSGGKKGSLTQGDMGVAAKYYGFTTITIGNLLKDGAGGFGLEFGNNGIVNDANPKPCASTDSREIVYLEAVFKFIADNPTLLDVTKVYTEGFSQNSMFAIYTAVCFADKVAGAWQGGSGLSKTAYDPVAPGLQGQCSFTSRATHEKSCCEEEFCSTCQYWPIYPKTCSHKIVDCIHAYTDDTIACGSDWQMYEAMVKEGNDARLLSFPGGATGSKVGGHQDPKNKWAWLTGCLGLTTACSSTCATSFTSCVNIATDSTSHEKFETCETKIKNAQLSGCTSGCAPTLEMLKLSETPVVTLSNGKFGTSTGLAQASGSAPKPNCKKTFGKFTDRTKGPKPSCSAPSSFKLGAENPSSTVCA